CVLLGAYVFLAANIYPRTDLLIEVALVCWGTLCFVESGRSLWICALSFIIVAVFASLVKITLLLLASISVGFISCELVLRSHSTLCFGVLLGFIAGFAFGWLALGQNLLHIGAFVSKALTTSLGYNAAMGYEGSQALRARGILASLLAAIAVLTCGLRACDQGDRNWAARHALLPAWGLSTLFLVWKHGFVRGDLYHEGFFFGSIPVLAMTSGVFPFAAMWPKAVSRASALVCCAVCLSTAQTMVLPGDFH